MYKRQVRNYVASIDHRHLKAIGAAPLHCERNRRIGYHRNLLRYIGCTGKDCNRSTRAACIAHGLLSRGRTPPVSYTHLDVYKRQGLYRQRKKLYLYPKALHKGAVLERVRELEGGGLTVGFGDSWFDVPMLRTCDTAWSLKGCELEGTDWGFPIRYSSLPAQAGTEEVLTLSLIHISSHTTT